MKDDELEASFKLLMESMVRIEAELIDLRRTLMLIEKIAIALGIRA